MEPRAIRDLVWRGALVVLLSAGLASGQSANPAATISPASTGTRPNAFHSTVDDLQSHGFIEQEFFVAGVVAGKAAPDQASSSQRYKTRLLVRRPVDPARFNGTVVVEWLNVALGYDLELGWPMFGDLMVRDGYAWIGISAQPAGIGYLKKWDPGRYGSLTHPAEAAFPSTANAPAIASTENYSDAIFSQVAAALRHPGTVDPLGGVRLQKLLAFGSAGSAIRLKPYINSLVGPGPYDGYFVHATAGAGKLRDDLAVPIFYLNSEWEAPAHVANRQADTRLFRYWEVPGSSHIARLAEDTLIRQSLRDEQADGWVRNCDFAPMVVSIEYVSRAALHHLAAWVKTGKEPPRAPFISVETSTNPPSIARDRHANAHGGVRLPHVEAPTGRHIAEGTPRENRICSFTGGYAPFEAATMASLYPTHAAYVSAVERAVERAVEAGYLLRADADAIRADAGASGMGQTRTAR